MAGINPASAPLIISNRVAPMAIPISAVGFKNTTRKSKKIWPTYSSLESRSRVLPLTVIKAF
jgi:hypothetical protein